MDLTFFLMADHASVTIDQKLNINGIFQNLSATNFPAVHPTLYLVVRLQASPAERGRRFRVQLKLLDEDGNEIGAINQMAVVPSPAPGSSRIIFVDQIFQLNGLQFPKAGDYQFSLLIDEDQKGDLEFSVNQIQPPQSPDIPQTD
jgi:hypothetical protein